MEETLYQHNQSGGDSYAVQYREYLKSLQWIKCHKELLIDLISLDYLLLIKLSSHTSIGSVWR